jgi:glycosyl transferase family 87
VILINPVEMLRFGRTARIAAWCTVVPLFGWAALYTAVHGQLGHDCHAYWAAWHRGELYTAAPTERDAYLYSPAFAQLIRPLALLPWPVFGALWMGGETLLLGWLVWPLRWAWRVPLFALCLPEMWLGNVHALFALVLVFGFRRPGWWAIPLLTKVTPAVGFVWFAARREWRKLSEALAWTGGIVAVSAAIDPGAWVDWVRFLLDHANGGPHSNAAWTVIHYAAAAVVLLYAIKSERRLLLVPAMILAAPVATYLAPLAVLAALPRMRVSADACSPSEPTQQHAHALC